jgi:hypothetical protein
MLRHSSPTYGQEKHTQCSAAHTQCTHAVVQQIHRDTLVQTLVPYIHRSLIGQQPPAATQGTHSHWHGACAAHKACIQNTG